ncbi:hypothetical protein SCHPADRAFT_886363 [Schizopora paradoxa]|uniref:Chromo domain-containing protein n=1 Tax=Schizopora paradoxa TaxID=27342 RepID=A0A0H2S2M5_9AGAM|nr:hypothetical protein SCHPADRAFT_886363 [Schizopora paradoxa]
MPSTYSKKRRPSERVKAEDDETQPTSSGEKLDIEEGDEDVWPVEKILGEKNGQYLIKWKGLDPKGKPWENSWVSKRDVTDDLIEEWNNEKSSKKRRKSKGKNTPSQTFQPPTRTNSLRKLGESSSTASNKRGARSSISLAPESTSTRRSETKAKPERLKTPPKKRKRPSRVVSTEFVNDESDEAPNSPRKKRKIIDDDPDELSTLSPSPVVSTKPISDNKPAVSSSPLTIYDEIPEPQPASRDVGKIIEKAKAVSRSSSNSRLNGGREKGPVAGPSRIVEKKSESNRMEDLKEVQKQANKTKKREKSRSAAPERKGDGKEMQDETISQRRSASTNAPKSRSKSKSGHETDEETRRPKAPERRSASKDKRPAYPEAQGGDTDADADGEPDDENVPADIDRTIDDDLPANDVEDLPMDLDVETHNSPRNSPLPPQSSPPRTSAKESAAIDTSVGTVIPETQSSKQNSSLDESSQQTQPNGVMGPPDTQGTQNDSISNFSSSGKVLKPIPVVTPSKFHPHLKTFTNVTGKAAALRKQLPPASGHVDPPPSSIVSQFSPEKHGENSASHWAVNGDGDTNTNGIEDDIENLEPSLEIKARGMELAEMDRMQRRTKLTVQKRSLDGILNHRDARPDAPAGHAQLDEDALVQQMEEQYVDLDGGADPAKVAVSENTVERPDDTPPDDAQPDPYLTNNVEETRHVSPTTEDSQQDDPQPMERPHTPQQSHLSKQRRQIINSPTRQLDSALGLLNQKSEEIHDLKGRISDGEEQRQIQTARIVHLEAENAQLAHEQSKSAQLEPTILAELDMIRKERDNIAKERDSALAELDLMKMSKQSAIDDAAFIREQYDLASARAMELAEENKDLSSRLSVAESQVTNGLQLVRNSYDARIATLNTELEKSRILQKILVERDRRTDDEIRKTAATVPQLEATIERLTKMNSDRKGEINALVIHRDALLVAGNESKDELDKLQEQYAIARADILHLSVEVARFGARERSVRKLIHPSPPEYDVDTEVDPAEEEVYLCEWLIDSETRCGELFSSVQDLQDHLFISAHI